MKSFYRKFEHFKEVRDLQALQTEGEGEVMDEKLAGDRAEEEEAGA
jgi:hypothetical protein